MTEYTERHETDDVHPVGTTVGVTAGAVAGGAIGSAVAGPLGTLLGAILGAIGGGKAGHEVAESLDDPVEDTYWRENFRTRPYVKDDDYEVYRPAYSYGWNARRRTIGHTWDDIENDLREGWESLEDKTRLTWYEARDAVRDGWERIETRFDGMFEDEDSYWRANYATRPYVATNEPYDTYRPAYEFGWRERVRRWDAKWEDVEDDLERSWDSFGDSVSLKWHQAKDAVRDAWHRIETRLPGDFDGDGR